MSRYVDADALKQKYTMATTRYSGGIMERPVVVLEAIDDAPSIEIIRCRDCKHGEYREDFDNYLCDQLGLGSVNDADFFCSYGESEGE